MIESYYDAQEYFKEIIAFFESQMQQEMADDLDAYDPEQNGDWESYIDSTMESSRANAENELEKLISGDFDTLRELAPNALDSALQEYGGDVYTVYCADCGGAVEINNKGYTYYDEIPVYCHHCEETFVHIPHDGVEIAA